MMKNKRIKKNWSEEDVQILLWVLSKHADRQGYTDVEKDLVIKFIVRLSMTGILLLR